MLPNFLVVGAEKAGTTSLAVMLAKHPEIYMSPVKEPRFFSSHNWGRGLSWYESLFEKAGGARAVGEASPAYTWGTNTSVTAKRIAETLGDIKYVYIVRHPVERLISQYRHALFNRWIPRGTSFEKALEILPELKWCSMYYHQIEQYLPYSKPDQWHVLSLENLRRDTQGQMDQIFRFLGVAVGVSVEMISSNVTDEKRQLPLWYLTISRWRRELKRRQLIVSKDVAASRISSALSVVGREVGRPDISTASLDRLMQEFIPDVQQLSEFFEYDFVAHWDLLKNAPANSHEEELIHWN